MIIRESAFAIRRIWWKEDTWIFSFLSSSRGLIHASLRVQNKKKKEGVERMPEIFSLQSLTLQKGQEELFKVRHFTESDRPLNRKPLKDFLMQSLLGRLTSISAREESPEPRLFSLWTNLCYKQDSISLLDLISGFLFAQGTWYDGRCCEQCDEVNIKTLYIERGQFVCQSCSMPSSKVLSSSQMRWIQDAFYKKESVSLSPQEENELTQWMVLRLGESFLRDQRILKTLRDLGLNHLKL